MAERRKVAGLALDFSGGSVFVSCSCCDEFGSGRWFGPRIWERGPEKAIQRAIAHALKHRREEQVATANAAYAAEYADALIEMEADRGR